MEEQELRDELVSNWGQRQAKIYLARKEMQKQMRRERIADGIQSGLFLILLCVITYIVPSL